MKRRPTNFREVNAQLNLFSDEDRRNQSKCLYDKDGICDLLNHKIKCNRKDMILMDLNCYSYVPVSEIDSKSKI